jgi:prevent-host-death family protein
LSFLFTDFSRWARAAELRRYTALFLIDLLSVIYICTFFLYNFEVHMSSIPVSELRANLMKVLKYIEHGESINITSRGKIVAKLVPPEDRIEAAEKRLEQIRKSAIIHDVLTPIDAKWKAGN